MHGVHLRTVALHLLCPAAAKGKGDFRMDLHGALPLILIATFVFQFGLLVASYVTSMTGKTWKLFFLLIFLWVIYVIPQLPIQWLMQLGDSLGGNFLVVPMFFGYFIAIPFIFFKKS